MWTLQNTPGHFFSADLKRLWPRYSDLGARCTNNLVQLFPSLILQCRSEKGHLSLDNS